MCGLFFLKGWQVVSFGLVSSPVGTVGKRFPTCRNNLQIDLRAVKYISNRYRNGLNKKLTRSPKNFLIQNSNSIIDKIFGAKSNDNKEVRTPISGVKIRSINHSATTPLLTLYYIRFCFSHRQNL